MVAAEGNRLGALGAMTLAGAVASLSALEACLSSMTVLYGIFFLYYDLYYTACVCMRARTCACVYSACVCMHVCARVESGGDANNAMDYTLQF